MEDRRWTIMNDHKRSQVIICDQKQLRTSEYGKLIHFYPSVLRPQRSYGDTTDSSCDLRRPAAVYLTGSGKAVIALLLDRRGNRVQITHSVVEVAAGNRESGN